LYVSSYENDSYEDVFDMKLILNNLLLISSSWIFPYLKMFSWNKFEKVNMKLPTCNSLNLKKGFSNYILSMMLQNM